MVCNCNIALEFKITSRGSNLYLILRSRRMSNGSTKAKKSLFFLYFVVLFYEIILIINEKIIIVMLFTFDIGSLKHIYMQS